MSSRRGSEPTLQLRLTVLAEANQELKQVIVVFGVIGGLIVFGVIGGGGLGGFGGGEAGNEFCT